MAIDWNRPIATSHARPRRGLRLPDCQVSGRKRIMFASKGDLLSEDDAAVKTATVYVYSEDGISRGDKKTSDWDVQNIPASA